MPEKMLHVHTDPGRGHLTVYAVSLPTVFWWISLAINFTGGYCPDFRAMCVFIWRRPLVCNLMVVFFQEKHLLPGSCCCRACQAIFTPQLKFCEDVTSLQTDLQTDPYSQISRNSSSLPVYMVILHMALFSAQLLLDFQAIL